MTTDRQTPSDEELARQAQAGSLTAFEELVYRYEGRIYRFVANSCRTEVDAREITQDTFVRAFQAIARFDGRRLFAPWLFTIAHRKRIDHQRAAPPLSNEPVPELPDNQTPADLLASREELAAIWLLARRSLPEAQFQALWLRYAEEMELTSIATVLRKTGTHVKVLLFRARKTLTAALARRQGTDEAALRQPAEPAGLSKPDAGATPNLLYEKLADTPG